MIVFDFHSDLLSRLLEEPIEGFGAGRGTGEFKHYDLPRIRAGGVRAVVWALYTENERGEHPVVRTLRMIDIADRLLGRKGRLIGSAILAALKIGQLSKSGARACAISVGSRGKT